MLYYPLIVAETVGCQVEEFDLATVIPLPKQGLPGRARHV
jgi:hypothetical protein